MFYALQIDSNGNGIGSHTYVEEPSTYPSNEVPCTQAQAQNPTLYQVVGGQIVESLTAAQSAQIALLQSSAQKAEQAPLTYTTSGGVTATFLMTPHQWTKFMGAYLKYVVKGDALPSGYAFFDQNGKSVAVTVADISGIFDAGMAQIDGAMVKLAGLIAQVEVATTVSDVQAITW
ncbi:hypothetical protein [Leptospirillum ferriphilum]|uniref:hypothetical protein n=1 Tax=Leptospirillum ferriphilum TaxID=178606 RepID=UPI000986262D|nr:hypothetical protein [Leptospirillum ferriphilum]OOH80800.1 hypothetical protein BOX30_05535 [Leptospirillum ferriphilum]